MANEPFQIHVAEEILDDLQYRLQHTRWPVQLHNAHWERGTEADYLHSLITYWKDHYDWREQEAELNRMSHYSCNIEDCKVHFIYERGKGPNPIPLILTHGWPDSFLRYRKIIPMLTDPSRYGGNPEDSFDVIVPSVPGFGFSSLPEQQSGFNNSRVADLWVKLMTEELGYSNFAAAGGDIGSGVTRYLAANYPERLFGIHLTDIGIIRDLINAPGGTELTEEEQEYKKRAAQWMADEAGYISIQSTRPQTLSYGLSDSPVGLAGWLVEKFRAWSDCNGDLGQRYSKDELLTHIMLYWITNTFGSSANIYYENTHSLPPLGHIGVPAGIALFAADILLPPKDWAMRNLNVTRWTELPRGGHFAAMEEPELLAEELRAYFRNFRVS